MKSRDDLTSARAEDPNNTITGLPSGICSYVCALDREVQKSYIRLSSHLESIK